MCKVIKGGTVRNEKLVQLVDGVPELPQVSQQDDTDIGLALDFECDLLIVSHAREGRMICAIKDRIKQIGGFTLIISLVFCNAYTNILKVNDNVFRYQERGQSASSQKSLLIKG